MTANVRPLVGRNGQRAEAGEVFRARARTGGGQPSGECDTEERRAVLTRAERAVGEIEHRREVNLHTGAAQRSTRVSPCRECLRLGANPPRRPCGWKLAERANVSALLVGEDERTGRPWRVAVPALHENAGNTGGSGKPGHDDKRSLLLR
jgi:hypothetical protein